MKQFLFVLVFTISVFTNVHAQTPYTSFKDDQQVTILNGIISKYILQNDPVFNWYASNQSGYTPTVELINTLEAAKGKVSFVIFGGTWCDDTQFILPRFFKLQEKSGIPDSSISFFGVNRDKKTLGNFADVFKIKSVPTIIVLKDGKEVGRVVEYGKTGKWDIELGELVK
ncbi:MAG: thioredoxin family protein [Ferruginibacter sp.]